MAIVCGTILLFCTPAAAQQTHKLVQMQVQCAEALAVWSVGLSLVVIPDKGAHLYKCGKPWMYLTAAYLYNDPTAEMAAAVAACLSFGIAAWCIRLLEIAVGNLYEFTAEPPTPACRMVSLWVMWLAVTLALSIPSALYIVSTSLPPGGFFGSTTLFIFQHAAVPALYGISALCIPPLARWAVNKVTGQSRPCIAARLMIFARLMVMLIVPFGMVLWLSQGCHAHWLLLWSPCRESGTFDISINVPYTQTSTSDAGSSTISITQHNDVCDPAHNTRYGDGRCPTAVVDALGKLLVEKLLFTALVGPVRLLLFNTEAVEQSKQWVLQKVGIQATTTTDVDTEVAGIIMLLEIALVLGFVVPAVPVVVCVAFVLHAKAFQISLEHQAAKLQHETMPPVSYLWCSLLLGAGLVMWMFVDSKWTGHILVCVGVPISCLVGAYASQVMAYFQRGWQVDAPDLAVALLEPESGDAP